MNNKERQKRAVEFQQQLDILNQREVLNRARGVTIGTAFGGVTEMSMRRTDGVTTFAILQPVEVVEIIHQLAANIGCHINIQPRKDFASWRNWKYTEEELAHYRGHEIRPGVGHAPHVKSIAPHVKSIAPHIDRGSVLPPAEQQPGLQPAMMARSENEQTVADQKPVKRSRAKRAATSA